MKSISSSTWKTWDIWSVWHHQILKQEWKVQVVYNSLKTCCTPHFEKQFIEIYTAFWYLENAYLLIVSLIFILFSIPPPPKEYAG